MINIGLEEVTKALPYVELVENLKVGFRSKITVPQRHHHDYINHAASDMSTLLLMPAWEFGKYVGVKIVNVAPENGRHGLPSIHGVYLLFDMATGQPLASLDSNTITKRRTAATSALASSYLSRENSKSLCVLGTGALAPQLIRAHCSIRPIKTVKIWGRDFKKADSIARNLSLEGIDIEATEDMEDACRNADIISSATLSANPLVKGEWLKKGQYIDLVGSYRPNMREADDEVISKSIVYCDYTPGATKESGDLAIPIATGILKIEEIEGDLFELCRGEKNGRSNDADIVVFKSVGHALEDLVAASMVYEKITA